MQVSNLVRKNILELRPYTSARSLFSGSDAILLDANESAADPSGEGWNRYPDPLQLALKTRLSQLKNVPADHIFLGNGSDEAIDLLLRIFCQPGEEEILICPPTYGMYEVMANIHGTGVRKVFLDEHFGLRPSEILAAVTPAIKLIFLCSPNNPTANLLDSTAIETLLRQFPGIVVVDEAYIDFSEGTSKEVENTNSWSQRLAKFPNLVILQTLSKAWALAGLRLGMAFASPEIIHYFNKVKYPYNLGALTQKLVLSALDGEDFVRAAVAEMLAQRRFLEEKLAELPSVQRIYPSDANFLLVKFENSPAVFERLKQQGVIVRNRSHEPLCENCLRITIGTKAENERLLQLLASF